MQKTNPDLIALYKERANCLRRGKPISSESSIAIEKLKRRPVVLSTITQNREDKLKEIITKFEDLQEQGFSKDRAARVLGYHEYSSIWKFYRELERIETEKKTQNNFKMSLKVNAEELSQKISEELVENEQVVETLDVDEPEN